MPTVFLYVPAAHAAHVRSDVDDGDVTWCLPGVQVVCIAQKDLPLNAWWLQQLGQSLQLAAFSVSEYLPAAHATQRAADESLASPTYLPGLQLPALEEPQ